MNDPKPPTIVEIGRPFIKYALPDTRCFASRCTTSQPGTPLEPIWKLRSALRDPKLDLVVCHPQYFAPWSLRWWLRHISHRNMLRGYLPLTSLFAPQLLRWPARYRLAIVDLEDCRFIEKCDRFLLARCDQWFKRELPQDSWQVFVKTLHPSVPTLRYRRKEVHQKLCAKLQPLPLGIKPGTEHEYPSEPVAKTTDLFWAGTCAGSSTVRTSGWQAMQRLRDLGFNVDVAEKSIPKKEFIQRAAAAYLVWSPEGYGWDCFRHYEAPLCWSVPVINYPTIQRHAPLVDGKHALFYSVEGDDLVRVVSNALSDRSRLVEMARTARQHVAQHHLLPAVASYIVRKTLQLDAQ